MRQYLRYPRGGISDKRFIRHDEKTLSENVLPSAQQFFLDAKMDGDIREVVSPRHRPGKECTEARPSTV